MSKPVYDSMPADEFIQKYGKRYDPENDDYDVGPFVADIKEGKNDPIYSAHAYHTKVPPRAIIPHILHYTEPRDIVLDPFSGSGMTGVAAVRCGVFLGHNTCFLRLRPLPFGRLGRPAIDRTPRWVTW